MAKSPTAPALSLDDDGESLLEWFQANSRTVGIVAGVLVAGVAGTLLWRSSVSTKLNRASAALSTAQTPFLAGDYKSAESELAKVATRYAGTMSGAQAAMLQAQAMFEQGKYKEGVAALEAARKAAPAEASASFHQLLGVGAEGQNDFAAAAKHYAEAATGTAAAGEKALLQASQARALTKAGRPAEALALWRSLAVDESGAVVQEARVRIGELVAAGTK
ncbi:MAG: tetratricopeptide repeat protein [Gemmatimonadaceae bacterium]|jgi:tetratricopeptide (TPR) repeat protein|nr:tetratricopeptide repeat protein [Gemmatimonadaceae bacterium]